MRVALISLQSAPNPTAFPGDGSDSLLSFDFFSGPEFAQTKVDSFQKGKPMDGNFWAEWAVPYFVSNAVALALAVLAWKRPFAARYGYALMFLMAALVNSITAMRNPMDYLNYASFAWGPYSEFIKGAFVGIVEVLVLAIALGQFLLALGFLARGRILRLACLGSIVFFLAITPLGMGAAFPFPLFAILGAMSIFIRSSELRVRELRT